MLGKYKYYFRKPKSEITKDIFTLLLMSGVLALGGGFVSQRYFLPNFLRQYPRFKKYPNQKLSNAFSRLKKRGLVRLDYRNHQLYISLTKEGRKRAGRLQIDTLMIKKPKKWDKKWRILIFDISTLKRTYREALRGKLKHLGFYKLQRSVWVHPFECRSEIDLLTDFFGFSDKEMRLITAEDIGEDSEVKKFFGM